METSSLKKTAVAAAVAGAFAVATTPSAHANVLNFTWTGAFTFLNPTGTPVLNFGTDYAAGYYADGSGGSGSFGAPTIHGWDGYRTPISGTLSFDSTTGAGVGTITPFQIFGDNPGSGAGSSIAYFVNPTFQVIDTIGSVVGAMLMSWNGGVHSMSIVLDASGLIAELPFAIGSGPTSTISGVGLLPATDGTNFGMTILGSLPNPTFLPLGPTPMSTKTFNTGAGCDGLSLATQVNAYTINTNFANVGTCTTGMVDDGIGGDPMTSGAFSAFNANFDFTSVHFDSFVTAPVPVPAAVWLFGSGLLGLIGLARQKKIN